MANSQARLYVQNFQELITAVYNNKAYFGDFSAGGLQTQDGVRFNDTAFTVKTSDIPVVIGTYNTGENVAFGTGTANSSRFGNRTEIIYQDTAVPYQATWAIHEGIDRFTVNADLNQAVADRLELQSEAKTQMLDNVTAEYISENAGETLELASVTAENVSALFDQLATYYVDLEVDREVVVKLKSEVYNFLVNSNLTVVEKRSGVNIDDNEVRKYKGFVIEVVPASKFQEGEYGYAYPREIGKVFLGINTTRTIESEDFDGMALQGAGKYGTWALPANLPAIVKITVPAPVGP